MKLTPLQKTIKQLKKACAESRKVDWFEFYLNKQRGSGNTPFLVESCKQFGGRVVVKDEKAAEQIVAMAGYDAKGKPLVKPAIVGDQAFAAQPGKSVIDNQAVQGLVFEAKQIQKLAEALLSLLERKNIQ